MKKKNCFLIVLFFYTFSFAQTQFTKPTSRIVEKIVKLQGEYASKDMVWINDVAKIAVDSLHYDTSLNFNKPFDFQKKTIN
jgi:hypothetical protein